MGPSLAARRRPTGFGDSSVPRVTAQSQALAVSSRALPGSDERTGIDKGDSALSALYLPQEPNWGWFRVSLTLKPTVHHALIELSCQQA